MKSLDQIGLNYRTDKSSPYHNYLVTYEQYFEEFRDQFIQVWELGIGDITSENREGESGLMWRDYFTNGQVSVFDNDPVKVERWSLKKHGISAYLADQTDKTRFENLVTRHGRPAIIIDDASHIQKNTIQSFQNLFPLSDDTSVKITVAKWLTPKGNTIDGIGIKPDVEVDFTEEDFKASIDPQLDKAKELLK